MLCTVGAIRDRCLFRVLSNREAEGGGCRIGRGVSCPVVDEMRQLRCDNTAVDTTTHTYCCSPVFSQSQTVVVKAVGINAAHYYCC